MASSSALTMVLAVSCHFQVIETSRQPRVCFPAQGRRAEGAQTPLTRRSAHTPAPNPAAPGRRQASVRWPSRRAESRVRPLRAPGNPDRGSQPAAGCAVSTAPAAAAVRDRVPAEFGLSEDLDARELQAFLPKPPTRLGVVGLRIRPRRADAVEVLATDASHPRT